ncbi:class C sortase [Microbacterium aurum]|uniref:class C sortase n=1 Tax=Microbacterium aurum TaxID=36805 RepID=UPI001EF57ECE|nr:class C sortase [Microbacterium aurum]MCG7415047.1 class C sortase [Microbacterium aurum]
MSAPPVAPPAVQPDPAPEPAPRARRRRSRRAGRIAVSVLLQVVAMAGIGLLVYPDAADWFARRDHNAEISGYVDNVEQTVSGERGALLDAAYAYNDQLQPGPLTDPYLAQSDPTQSETAVYQAYEQLLSVSGSDAIGTLSYPAVGITLPIYHGTSDETLGRGVGHLYGSSMPVGGPSTHAVLTSHSGLPQAKLFTPLLGAKVGDTFWISVLGEDHYYRVQSTETVLPGETESLAIVPGQDLVTLFTCAPIGVNSHRFMVHAVRIADPPADAEQVIAGDGLTAGFPWWAVWFVGGSLVVAVILFAPPRRKRR